MIEIKNLLERFSSIILSEENKRESVRRAVSETLHMEIKSEDVKIKNSVIYLNIKPIYKNEVLMKREQIFKRLQELFLGKNPPLEIR
ncbi:MAG: hypothetical protein WCT29_02795 [Candidatus Paceibacterota bacterium]|jgi:hypothetical protein